MFSQRDPLWKNDRLGTGILTVGQAGCLVSAAAGLLVDSGVPTDPHRLNLWLISNHGYYDDDLLIFRALEGLGVKLIDVIFCANEPAPISRLAKALEDGAFVVVLVGYMPGGAVDQHWVRISAVSETAGKISDPWRLPGKTEVDLSIYLASGWTPARGIFAAAIYGRADGRKWPVTACNGRRQGARCVRA